MPPNLVGQKSGPRRETICEPLIARLDAAFDLSKRDKDSIRGMCSDVRSVPVKRDIISEGETPDHVHVMLGGWAARYRILPNGSRQIMAFLIPGDFCDLQATVLRKMDHGIVALTSATVALVSHRTIKKLFTRNPHLGLAFLRAMFVDEAISRSWLINVGRRDALKRVAHLLCELHVRSASVGLADELVLPLTQQMIADANALTTVHVNRTLARLRIEGLIRVETAELTIIDVAGLRKIGGFSPDYLRFNA